ncbi:MAG: hypothetical protein MI784_11895 [Cytophagales bacterium]|nr:hypothetical protein [Cytophagales bacterium]
MKLEELEIPKLLDELQGEYKKFNQTLNTYLRLQDMLHDEHLFPDACYLQPLQKLIDLTEKELRILLTKLGPKQKKHTIAAKIYLELTDFARFRETKNLNFLSYYIYQLLENHPDISLNAETCSKILVHKLDNLDYQLVLNSIGDECIVVKFRNNEIQAIAR